MPRPKPGRKKSILFRLLVWAAVICLLAVGGASLYAYHWVQNYIKSDDFRLMLSRQLGKATGTQVTMKDMALSGQSVHVSAISLNPVKVSGWRKIEADRIEANVEWNSLRDRVVDIPVINIDWASLQLRSDAEKLDDLPLSLDQQMDTLAVPAWLKRWMPNRTRIGTIVTEEFDLLPGADGGIEVQDMHLTAKPVEHSNNSTWQLAGKNGSLTWPGNAVPFKFTSAHAILNDTGLTLNDSIANWQGNSEITLRGKVPFSAKESWRIEGQYRNLEMSHFIQPSLSKKVRGDLLGDYEANAAGLKGNVVIKNGVVQDMPVLDRIADFTRTDRFRRIVFDQAKADFEKRGENLHFRNIVLHSNGLVRVEGDVRIHGRNLSGVIYVGVTTSSLRWIPGSQRHVFRDTRPGSPEGFVWTSVDLSGTLDDPKEDLSNRLLAAMGKALLLDAPLGAAKLGTDVIKGTGEGVIKGSGKAAETIIETGTDILKKVIPGL